MAFQGRELVRKPESLELPRNGKGCYGVLGAPLIRTSSSVITFGGISRTPP